MITQLSHSSIYVLDHETAYDFYVNKLGFEVREDVEMGENNRWLTVSPEQQPDLEIILMLASESNGMSSEQVEALKKLIKAGTFGFGVFQSKDVRATYEELKQKGVKFKQPPKEQFYGIETIMEDPFGNWFSLTQRKDAS